MSLHHNGEGALIWLGFNAYSDDLEFELPVPTSPWKRAIDTAQLPGMELPEQMTTVEGSSLNLKSRSLVLLLAGQVAKDLKF